jgi:hypothetical protein
MNSNDKPPSLIHSPLVFNPFTESGTDADISQGGEMLLETGDKMLLETGDIMLLEG